MIKLEMTLEKIMSGDLAGVMVDPSTGISSTFFPTGTDQMPVNNWNDAVAIMTQRIDPMSVRSMILKLSEADYKTLLVYWRMSGATQTTIDVIEKIRNGSLDPWGYRV
jgi:hypothetical protein